MVVHAPTGFGKTIVAAALVREATVQGKRIIVVLPALFTDRAGKAFRAPEPQHIARLRIIGLALMPTLAGVVMMLGMALRRETES
jgi:hypothetical protein